MFKEESEIYPICADLTRENWWPATIIRKGEFLEKMRRTLHPDDRVKLKGVIIAFSYINVYHD